MTLAACEIDTVGWPAVVTAGGFWAPLTLDSSRTGPFPGAGDPLDGAGAALLDGALVATALEDAAGAWVAGLSEAGLCEAGLCEAGLGETGLCEAGLCEGEPDGGSAAGEVRACGPGESTVVTGALTVVGGAAGATVVTAGATVVCVTGGGASTDCGVCGGAWTLRGAGGGSGASDGGACDAGASTCSGACTCGAGAGAVVVVTWSVFGLANAGAIPPVSAVREITAPDASTTTALRLEQVLSGAPICASLLLPRQRGGVAPLLQDQSLIGRNCYIGTCL